MGQGGEGRGGITALVGILPASGIQCTPASAVKLSKASPVDHLDERKLALSSDHLELSILREHSLLSPHVLPLQHQAPTFLPLSACNPYSRDRRLTRCDLRAQQAKLCGSVAVQARTALRHAHTGDEVVGDVVAGGRVRRVGGKMDFFLAPPTWRILVPSSLPPYRRTLLLFASLHSVPVDGEVSGREEDASVVDV
eukprot:746574-Hanusia_phi.AAC.3